MRVVCKECRAQGCLLILGSANDPIDLKLDARVVLFEQSDLPRALLLWSDGLDT